VTLGIVVIVLALALLVVIVEVVRRRRLSENYALLWIGVGVAALVLGAARPLVDELSSELGIVFGTSLVFALACLFLTIVCINLSVHVSKLEERVEVLAQELALQSPAAGVAPEVDDQSPGGAAATAAGAGAGSGDEPAGSSATSGDAGGAPAPEPRRP
jgi:hypothetical protein